MIIIILFVTPTCLSLVPIRPQRLYIGMISHIEIAFVGSGFNVLNIKPRIHQTNSYFSSFTKPYSRRETNTHTYTSEQNSTFLSSISQPSPQRLSCRHQYGDGGRRVTLPLAAG